MGKAPRPPPHPTPSPKVVFPKHSLRGVRTVAPPPKFPRKSEEEISAAGQQQGRKLERRKNFPMPKDTEGAAKEGCEFLSFQAP